MRFRDLIGLPVSALWRQKVRAFLTTLGVVFGAFVLAASLSIGQGVQDLIERISHRTDLLRKIQVFPKQSTAIEQTGKRPRIKGQFSDARQKRLQQSLDENGNVTPGSMILLSRSMLKTLASLPHVVQVVPSVSSYGHLVLNGKSQSAQFGSAGTTARDISQRIVTGRFFKTIDEQSLIVHEFLLYQLGLTTDAEMTAVLGKKLRLEFRPVQQSAAFQLYVQKADGEAVTLAEQVVLDKITGQLPAMVPQLKLEPADLLVLQRIFQGQAPQRRQTISAEYTVVGIMRSRSEAENRRGWDPFASYANAILPCETALDLAFRMLPEKSRSADSATVIVEREQDAAEIVQQIKDLGLEVYAPLEHIERERLMYLLIFGGMTCIAAVALLVAALGITNTMLMSVLERTREIGIMKAVGAGNGTLQFLFLLEGSLIGLFGGTCGLLACWAASFPGDRYIHNLVLKDLKVDVDGSLFAFPPWLSIVVISFAVAVTTLAAVLPARRAARIDPVKALRHE